MGRFQRSPSNSFVDGYVEYERISGSIIDAPLAEGWGRLDCTELWQVANRGEGLSSRQMDAEMSPCINLRHFYADARR